MAEQDNQKVPFSAKLGWGVTWVVMVILLVMLTKNFIGSFIFGMGTDQERIDSYYSMGNVDARDGIDSRLAELQLDNPLFIKAYKRGFREGVDRKWQAEKMLNTGSIK